MSDATQEPARGPLHGYRILDTSSMIAGPLATRILADQGDFGAGNIFVTDVDLVVRIRTGVRGALAI